LAVLELFWKSRKEEVLSKFGLGMFLANENLARKRMGTIKDEKFISFARLEGMKVLVVDDNTEDLNLLIKCFWDTGLKVLFAKNGKSVLDIIEKVTPDLILLDVVMPEMNGFETCVELKKNESMKDVPVIFVTAKETTEDFMHGFSVGGVDYIKKPICKEEVLVRSRIQLILRKEAITKDHFIKKVKHSSHAKTEFMARMSHELRTPMNAILGFGQLLKTDAQRDEANTRVKDVDCILRAGKHLLELINEVLDLSQIEAGKLKISLEPVSITELKSEILDFTGSLIEQKGIHLIDECLDDESLYVNADKARLRQVLLNLLSNAIKYNRDNGTIKLEAFKRDGFLRFTVSDTGPGIPVDLQERIFEPFDRLGGESSDIDGTGIGLVISKKLMDLMSGSIGFDSREGEGSSFYIDIPLASYPSLEPERTDYEKIMAIEEDVKTSQKTVLYIEDNPANLQLVKRIMSIKEDVRLISAAEAESGIQLALSEKPTLILMDINLPGMNGFEAFNILKAKEKTENIPVVAVSADAMTNDKNKAYEMGFKSYITKPININGFLREIDKFLK
jgi:signal transduction histidine kinase